MILNTTNPLPWGNSTTLHVKIGTNKRNETSDKEDFNYIDGVKRKLIAIVRIQRDEIMKIDIHKNINFTQRPSVVYQRRIKEEVSL